MVLCDTNCWYNDSGIICESGRKGQGGFDGYIFIHGEVWLYSKEAILVGREMRKPSDGLRVG